MATEKVALFVTCLVDTWRPSIGFASLKLLERAGTPAEVPRHQTCCGQPAFNNGDTPTARRIAEQVIDTFQHYDHIVVPSGSCGGMLKTHYPEIFENDEAWAPRAREFAARVSELSDFLLARGLEVSAHCEAVAAYHDSCSSQREMNVRDQPRALLGQVGGLEVRDLEEPETCCGFGGTFCVKYPEISERMVSDKVADIGATGADMLLAGDLGCLMNIAGRLSREGRHVRVFHYAEILAGMANEAGLGEDGR